MDYGTLEVEQGEYISAGCYMCKWLTDIDNAHKHFSQLNDECVVKPLF